MVPELNIRRRWRMFRHEYGFGIHSPFAYRFITEVIRQPYAYYAYAALPDKRQRLIFRIAVELRCRRVAVYGPAAWGKAARMSSRKTTVRPERPDLAILDARSASDADCHKVCADITAGASAIAFYTDSKLRAAMLDALGGSGMSFQNSRGCLIVVNRALPRQHFEVSF